MQRFKHPTTDYQQRKQKIDIYVQDGADISQQELVFELPEGTTIEPKEKQPKDNPPIYDFSLSDNRKFIVTSEDKSNNAEYDISIFKMELPLLYSFDNLAETNPYHILYLSDQSKSCNGLAEIQVTNLPVLQTTPMTTQHHK